MKKSQIALLIIGVLTAAGVPSIIAIDQANQARIETQRARKATLQAQEAAEAERLKLQEEQEAIRQRAAQREREEAARRAEEQARREEAARIAAEQQRQEQERLAARKQARQQMVTRTTNSWNQFAEVMVTAANTSAETDEDTLNLLRYVVNALEPIPTQQIDPKVATLISDVRQTTQQAYALAADYRDRQTQVGIDAAEAGKFGCEAVNAMREQNSLGWCALAGVLSSGISYAHGSAELEQLGQEYASHLQEMAEAFESYRDEFEVMPGYLQTTYGINAMEI